MNHSKRVTSIVEAQHGLRGACGHLVPLNVAAFVGHCLSPSKGRENEEGDGRNNSQTFHSVISQTHFLSFYSMPDPGTGNTETNKELSEQRAREGRAESSVTWVRSARKEKASLRNANLRTCRR